MFGPCRDTLVTFIVELVTADREGKVVDRVLLKNAIGMFLVMGFIEDPALANLQNDKATTSAIAKVNITEEFKKTFEAPFIEHSRLYFSKVVESVLHAMDTASYLVMVR